MFLKSLLHQKIGSTYQNYICCVFWPAFGSQKLVEIVFFCRFQHFLVILNLLSHVTAEINKKHLKRNKTMCFCRLLKAGWHAKASRLPEGVPWNCLFWADFLLFKHFLSVFDWFWSFSLIYSTKKVENGQKKVFQPAIGFHQHPKAGEIHNIQLFLLLEHLCVRDQLKKRILKIGFKMAEILMISDWKSASNFLMENLPFQV